MKPAGCGWFTFSTIVAILLLASGNIIEDFIGVALGVVVLFEVGRHFTTVFGVRFGPFRMYLRRRKS